MKTKNAMSLKALIKKKAKELQVAPQQVFQNYIMECFLDRLANSPYGNNFILKGGFLLASMLGLDVRSTMDIDTTSTGFSLSKEEVAKIMNCACEIDADDDFSFAFDRVEDIREKDEYPGIRAFLFANYEKIHAPLTMDITTGDQITPSVIEFTFKRLFDDNPIKIKSYPIETVIAEKLETILSRNIANTRPRDFYDVYMLKPKVMQCSANIVKTALTNTAKKRGTEQYLYNHQKIVSEISEDKSLNEQWNRYARIFPYAKTIQFKQVCDVISELLERTLG